MLTLPRLILIFISSGPTDMRRSIDGLMSIVKDELEGDVYSEKGAACSLRPVGDERSQARSIRPTS